MQDKAILIEDILSYRKNNKKDVVYGTKGEVVTIIAEHGDVFIVEGRERFSVDKSKLEFINKVLSL